MSDLQCRKIAPLLFTFVYYYIRVYNRMYIILLYYTLVHLYGTIKKKWRGGENTFRTDVRFPGCVGGGQWPLTGRKPTSNRTTFACKVTFYLYFTYYYHCTRVINFLIANQAVYLQETQYNVPTVNCSIRFVCLNTHTPSTDDRKICYLKY